MKRLVAKAEAGFYGFGYDSSKPDQSDAVFSMGLGLGFVRFMHFALVLLLIRWGLGLNANMNGMLPYLYGLAGVIAMGTTFWKIYGGGLNERVQAHYARLDAKARNSCHVWGFCYGVGSIGLVFAVGIMLRGS